MSLKSYTLLASTFISITTTVALATPRQDCETAISTLGYPLAGYVFEERGIFSMEKHHIGGVTCYIDINDEVDSLYMGDEVLAEDGYFGREALQERDRIRGQAQSDINTARDDRNAKIDKAREEFDEFEANVEDRTNDKLAAVREASNPFLDNGSGAPEELANAPVEEAPSGGQAEPPTEQEGVPPETAPVGDEPDLSEKARTVGLGREQRVSSEELERRYVTADRLMRRSCPSSDCGSIGGLLYREGVNVLEERNGWVRYTELMPALCEDGISQLIETGSARCTKDNGIVDGRVAFWVHGDHLSTEEPEDPADSATAYEQLIKNSTNFRHHRSVFAQAAADLIDSGRCTRGDFEEFGSGWMKSTGEQQNQPIYFMYCGGFTLDNKVELNVETGRIVQ